MYFENGLLVLLDLLVAFVISLHALLFWCFTILNKTKQNPPIYCIECIISSAFSNKILNLRFLSSSSCWTRCVLWCRSSSWGPAASGVAKQSSIVPSVCGWVVCFSLYTMAQLDVSQTETVLLCYTKSQMLSHKFKLFSFVTQSQMLSHKFKLMLSFVTQSHRCCLTNSNCSPLLHKVTDVVSQTETVLLCYTKSQMLSHKLKLFSFVTQSHRCCFTNWNCSPLLHSHRCCLTNWNCSPLLHNVTDVVSQTETVLLCYTKSQMLSHKFKLMLPFVTQSHRCCLTNSNWCFLLLHKVTDVVSQIQTDASMLSHKFKLMLPFVTQSHRCCLTNSNWCFLLLHKVTDVVSQIQTDASMLSHKFKLMLPFVTQSHRCWSTNSNWCFLLLHKVRCLTDWNWSESLPNEVINFKLMDWNPSTS